MRSNWQVAVHTFSMALETSDSSFFNVEMLFEVIQIHCIDESQIKNELTEKKKISELASKSLFEIPKILLNS